jgi:hypothetical protein
MFSDIGNVTLELVFLDIFYPLQTALEELNAISAEDLRYVDGNVNYDLDLTGIEGIDEDILNSVDNDVLTDGLNAITGVVNAYNLIFETQKVALEEAVFDLLTNYSTYLSTQQTDDLNGYYDDSGVEGCTVETIDGYIDICVDLKANFDNQILTATINSKKTQLGTALDGLNAEEYTAYLTSYSAEIATITAYLEGSCTVAQLNTYITRVGAIKTALDNAVLNATIAGKKVELSDLIKLLKDYEKYEEFIAEEGLDIDALEEIFKAYLDLEDLDEINDAILEIASIQSKYEEYLANTTTTTTITSTSTSVSSTSSSVTGGSGSSSSSTAPVSSSVTGGSGSSSSSTAPVSTTATGGSTTATGGSTTAPVGTTTPSGATTAPVGSTTAPVGSTTATGGSTTGGSTTAPITTTPGGATTAPVGSSTAPVETTPTTTPITETKPVATETEPEPPVLEVDENGAMKKDVKNFFSLREIILNAFSDKLAPEQEKAADVNNDGIVNIFDSGIFKKKLLQDAVKIIANQKTN